LKKISHPVSNYFPGVGATAILTLFKSPFIFKPWFKVYFRELLTCSLTRNLWNSDRKTRFPSSLNSPKISRDICKAFKVTYYTFVFFRLKEIAIWFADKIQAIRWENYAKKLDENINLFVIISEVAFLTCFWNIVSWRMLQKWSNPISRDVPPSYFVNFSFKTLKKYKFFDFDFECKLFTH